MSTPAYKLEHRRKGLCIWCPRKAVPTLLFCLQCRQKNLVRNRKIKAEIFSHYCKGSPRCQCPGCPISFLDGLTIDHIKGNGATQRKKLAPKIHAGRGFYYWLRRHNFPKGFQILCGACNIAKGSGAACPAAHTAHGGK